MNGMKQQRLAKGKGGFARNRLKEAHGQTCEPTNRNFIQGSASGQAGTTQPSPSVQEVG